MAGGPLALLAIAAAAGAFAFREPLEDTVTQKLQPTAYTRWDEKLKAAARAHGVADVALGGRTIPGWWQLKAMMWQESDLGRYPSVARGLEVPSDVEGSRSQDGKSWGLMQVTIPTAGDFRAGTTAVDLNNPDLSIELGARIHARNQKIFPGNLEYQVRAYNGGPGFLKTARGISDTPIHWAKVKAKLDKIIANGG